MFILILIALGLCFGSFVNAFVYRLYENDKDTYYEAKKHKIKRGIKKLSIWNGRSICVNCKHQLSALDLIPVFSWVFLKGRCRYCNKAISWQYPTVELVTASLFVLSYIYWPQEFNNYQIGLFGFWCVYLIGFMALSVFDLRWYLLPNKIIFGLLGVYVLELIFMAIVGGTRLNGLFDPTIGALTLSGFFWLLFRISKGKWIGGGDVKLGLLLGALSGGFVEALLIIFIASLLGSIIGGTFLFISQRFKLKTQLPFGPYLMLATVIVVLFGERLLDGYLVLVGLK